MHDPKKVLEICEKATPGPWIHQHEHHGESVLYNDSNVVCFPYNFIDAQFVVLARTALPEFAQRVIDLEQQRREDMELMEETLGAQKMALATIEKYKSENTKLRAVAEAAMKVVRVKFCQITYEHQENIMELEQALAAAGFGGESDDKKNTCNGMGEVEVECGRCKQLEKEISEAKKVINDCEYTYDRLTYEVPLDVSIQAILGQINEGAQEIIELDAQASVMREALKQCNLFVTNGIELGYIQMPDPCTNDPALKIPSMIHKALSLDAGKALLERVQRLESIAEAAQEVLQKEPTIICPRCDGSAGAERCVCEPWEMLRQTVVEYKRVEGGK